MYVVYRVSSLHTVTHRPVARQSPQHTSGQVYRSGVFCDLRTNCYYATHAKHIVVYAVTPHNNREAVFPAVLRAEWLQGTTEEVFSCGPRHA
jgi:hypothetical protein